MEQPLVSIICACYNQSKFVIESLESVKNQTYKNIEIVIWDDVSKDNSVEKIEHWISNNPQLKITFTKNIENKGICKSLNEAQSLTKGKYIQLLALDDILLPDKISTHVKILENSTENEALVFSDAYLMNEESEIYQNKFLAYHKRYLSLKTENYFEELLKGNFIPVMSILFKKKILNEIGKWDENLSFEDYDMLLRIAKRYDFIFDEKPSVKYRFHENNTHKKLTGTMKDSLFKIYLKYINYNDFVNSFLLKTVISLYEENKLNGENVAYFAINKPRGFFENWIARNKNLKTYRFLKKIKNSCNIFLIK
jgi:glycosyltransferase involved in cell wall biosynthesis